jgi:hypothetical protein
MNATNTFAEKAAAPAAAQAPIAQAALDMLRLIEDFGALLRQETEALKKSDFRHVDLLQQDKRDYAKKYHAAVTGLSARRGEVLTLEAGMQERLIKARTAFTLILNENLRTLEAAKDSARRLVDRILDSARRAVADEMQTNYSAKGSAQAYKTAGLSLSVDRSL